MTHTSEVEGREGRDRRCKQYGRWHRPRARDGGGDERRLVLQRGRLTVPLPNLGHQLDAPRRRSALAYAHCSSSTSRISLLAWQALDSRAVSLSLYIISKRKSISIMRRDMVSSPTPFFPNLESINHKKSLPELRSISQNRFSKYAKSSKMSSKNGRQNLLSRLGKNGIGDETISRLSIEILFAYL